MTQHALTARADRRLIRAHRRSQRFVLVGVTAPPATQQRDRLPVNLAFVLDRSGSMSGEKIDLAKRTVAAALEHLDERDRFSIVVYDDVVDVVVESTPGSAEARRNAIARLSTIDARGSTNLSEGWFRGAEQVAGHLIAEGVNRCLVLTDGLANRGLTDPGVLAGHASELRVRGVSTTTFGVGADFDEVLLQGIADAGGGHFYFVRDAATIRDHITSEVGETLEVVARDVELEVVSAEEVDVEAISPQPTRRRGTRTVVSLGDLVAEQVLDIVLRITFPYGEIGRETGVIIGLTDRDGVFAAGGRAGASDARLAWTYADDAANDGQPRDADVDTAVATQFAARARQEAVALNRAGDYVAARQVLDATGRRIRAYAGHNATLRKMVTELQDEGETFAAPMPAMALKEAHFASANLARTRDAMGRSRRER
ncbi:MAG TPA: VWA domain-containing protein [Candidatus Limnocylindrales bacterium]|nr:VWA domain-containing protein [Candidatus Limnocylindrales bacterium]